MNTTRLQKLTFRHPYLFALGLLVVVLGVNFYLQPNLFQLRVLSSNLRIFLPLMILTAGQAIVIIGGGIDLSVGTMVSMVNAILVTWITRDSTPPEILTAIAVGAAAGMAAGLLNGLCVAYLRLQPIVTTYATSFIFAGMALWILPRPGGLLPSELTKLYRANPLGVPLTIWIAALLILLWLGLRATRYGRYLFAVGGKPEAAYATGVPVSLVRLSTYVIAGLMSALAALALTLSTGTGDPRIGEAMTLPSIVAVVLGGTRLSGGQGGIAGSLIGVVILGSIRNIISFAQVPTWWQTLVDALIIVSALAGPGLVRLVRRQVKR
ncbi:MAG: ABC transporter permease [Chloroflexi bacterium]|nr:MAG: ABC transporter permease [Chloroflexota bacterium]